MSFKLFYQKDLRQLIDITVCIQKIRLKMKIISIKSYRNGYTGIVEEDDKYILFNLSKNGKFKKINKYKKEEFVDYNHFVGTLSKFIPNSSFLKEPVKIGSITIEELDRVFSKIK